MLIKKTAIKKPFPGGKGDLMVFMFLLFSLARPDIAAASVCLRTSLIALAYRYHHPLSYMGSGLLYLST